MFIATLLIICLDTNNLAELVFKVINILKYFDPQFFSAETSLSFLNGRNEKRCRYKILICFPVSTISLDSKKKINYNIWIHLYLFCKDSNPLFSMQYWGLGIFLLEIFQKRVCLSIIPKFHLEKETYIFTFTMVILFCLDREWDFA